MTASNLRQASSEDILNLATSHQLLLSPTTFIMYRSCLVDELVLLLHSYTHLVEEVLVTYLFFNVPAIIHWKFDTSPMCSAIKNYCLTSQKTRILNIKNLFQILKKILTLEISYFFIYWRTLVYCQFIMYFLKIYFAQ